jgi:hypothetical protein
MTHGNGRRTTSLSRHPSVPAAVRWRCSRTDPSTLTFPARERAPVAVRKGSVCRWPPRSA